MISLNCSTAEELLFYDTGAQSRLPAHFFNHFEQWRLSKRIPFLRDLGKQAVLDLLNELGEDEVAILEDYFGDKITVEKLNYQVAVHVEAPIDSACGELCETAGFDRVSAFRNGDKLHLTFWR